MERGFHFSLQKNYYFPVISQVVTYITRVSLQVYLMLYVELAGLLVSYKVAQT